METDIETSYGKLKVKVFKQLTTGDIHLAFLKGDIVPGEPTLVRVHSSTETGDILGILFDGYAEQLSRAMQMIAASDRGILLFMRQVSRQQPI
jgi:3,4-dihydroxy 2-butanone 4-phosphate synthase/GTP cyclohydrolase II